MKIKKGDTIIVISGKDKGKTGVVSRAFPKLEKILVEGVNMKKRHTKPRRSNQKGQIVEKSLPIHVSNVMLVDPKKGGRTRIGISREGGKRVRVAKKSKVSI